jgi:hypothetical protein
METLAWRGRKSSYSGDNGGARVEVGAWWHKSSYSGSNGGAYVEIARDLPGAVAVRDSKNPDGPVLTFGWDEWATFITRVRATA